MERTIERRREPEPQETISERIFRFWDENTKKMKDGKIVIKGEDISWEQNPMSLIKPYTHPVNWDELGVPGWIIFRHFIRKHSGSHRHQGGLGIFVLDGKGYTLIDGMRHDWEKNDLIIIPVVPGGCEHQHFNLEPGKPAEWLAFIFNPFIDALGNERVQVANSPDYKGAAVRLGTTLPHAG